MSDISVIQFLCGTQYLKLLFLPCKDGFLSPLWKMFECERVGCARPVSKEFSTCLPFSIYNTQATASHQKKRHATPPLKRTHYLSTNSKRIEKAYVLFSLKCSQDFKIHCYCPSICVIIPTPTVVRISRIEKRPSNGHLLATSAASGFPSKVNKYFAAGSMLGFVLDIQTY